MLSYSYGRPYSSATHRLILIINLPTLLPCYKAFRDLTVSRKSSIRARASRGEESDEEMDLALFGDGGGVPPTPL